MTQIIQAMEIKEMIETLSQEEAMAVNVWAVNASMDKTKSADERKAYDLISDLAIERFAKVYTENNRKVIKASASMTFGKYVDMDMFEEVNGRYLAVDVEVKASSEAEVEEAFQMLAEQLEAEASVEIDWALCPTIEENNGVWSYQDCFCIEYDHGYMTAMKKALKAEFKAVKKVLGFK